MYYNNTLRKKETIHYTFNLKEIYTLTCFLMISLLIELKVSLHYYKKKIFSELTVRKFIKLSY
jgi:hypothetical protein